MQDVSTASRIVRSLLYGWLGAIFAGLVVAIWALVSGMPENRMIAVSSAAGMMLGSAAMVLPWARRRAVVRAYRRR